MTCVNNQVGSKINVKVLGTAYERMYKRYIVPDPGPEG